MNVPGLTRENVASHLQVRQISYSKEYRFLKCSVPSKRDLVLIADEL
jgi:hypothetical protein